MIGDMATSETLVCFLCNGIVAYKDRNPSKFNRHMNSEHNAYYGLEYLLASCTMSEEERGAVREVTRNRTDKQLNEGGDGIADSERKRQKHSDSKKKKCPECPISFVFQADLTAHLESSHPNKEIRRRNSVKEGGKHVEGEMLVDSQTLGLVDSKQDKELLDKIKDFNEASRELKEKSVGGSAPDLPRKDSMGHKSKKPGPAKGLKMTKEEAWKAATTSKLRVTRGSLTREKENMNKDKGNDDMDKENMRRDKENDIMDKGNSEEFRSTANIKEPLKDIKNKKEPLKDIKKRLENMASVKATPISIKATPIKGKATPIMGKKLKLKKKKFERLQKIDRSHTPNKKIADAGEDPGTGTTCPLCGKQFPKNGPMRRHFEDIHQPGEYPCPGEGCGKVFTSKNKMSSHRSRNCNPNKDRRKTL